MHVAEVIWNAVLQVIYVTHCLLFLFCCTVVDHDHTSDDPYHVLA